MKDLLLVLLGALISCGTAFLLEWFKFNKEEQTYYKRKKEEVYLEMMNVVTIHYANLKQMKTTKKWSNENRKLVNNIRAKAELYVNKNVADKFYNVILAIIDDIIENKTFDVELMDELTNDIKRDLKIKIEE